MAITLGEVGDAGGGVSFLAAAGLPPAPKRPANGLLGAAAAFFSATGAGVGAAAAGEATVFEAKGALTGVAGAGLGTIEVVCGDGSGREILHCRQPASDIRCHQYAPGFAAGAPPNRPANGLLGAGASVLGAGAGVAPGPEMGFPPILRGTVDLGAAAGGAAAAGGGVVDFLGASDLPNRPSKGLDRTGEAALGFGSGAGAAAGLGAAYE